jgi:hypothetical protein
MSVLRIILLGPTILLISACSKPSPEYQHIRDLPYDQWPAYGKTLPIKKRLDLQMEIVKRSGHPPSMDMVPAFRADPAETYKEIVNRLKSGDRSHYYRTILYEIDGSNGFEICSQPDRRIVQGFLIGISTPAVRSDHRPKFYTC